MQPLPLLGMAGEVHERLADQRGRRPDSAGDQQLDIE